MHVSLTGHQGAGQIALLHLPTRVCKRTAPMCESAGVCSLGKASHVFGASFGAAAGPLNRCRFACRAADADGASASCAPLLERPPLLL